MPREIWWVDLGDTKGSETNKTRPAVVVSTDVLARLPVRLVVPLTDWKDKHDASPWHVRVEPTPENGLRKTSAADALQTRCVSIERFKEKLGRLNSERTADVAAALAAVIEYQ